MSRSILLCAATASGLFGSNKKRIPAVSRHQSAPAIHITKMSSLNLGGCRVVPRLSRIRLAASALITSAASSLVKACVSDETVRHSLSQNSEAVSSFPTRLRLIHGSSVFQSKSLFGQNL